MKDIQFIKPQTTQINPYILGKTSTYGLILYQKILVLLLSSSSDLYRQREGTTLLDILDGSNTPSDQLLQVIGSSACGQLITYLDSSDTDLIQSLTADANMGRLSIILTLKTGQSYEGFLT